MAVKVEAFLTLEKALTDKLLRGWRTMAVTLLPRIYEAIEKGDTDQALKLVANIDLSPLLKKHRFFFKQAAYASLFFGASRLTPEVKASIIAKGGMQDVVNSSVDQLGQMILISVQDAIKEELQAFIAQADLEDETKPLGASESVLKGFKRFFG